MASNPYPVRLGDERTEKIKEAAKAIDLPFPETIRQAIDYGLPVLVEKLRKEPAKRP